MPLTFADIIYMIAAKFSFSQPQGSVRQRVVLILRHKRMQGKQGSTKAAQRLVVQSKD